MNQFLFPDIGQHGMAGEGSGGDAEGDLAYRIGIGFDAEAGEGGGTFVNATVIPEIGFGTAETTMPALDGEAGAAVPLGDATGIVGGGALAAHFIETVSLAGILIIEGIDE